ncbi:hypothetical protein F9K97_22360 [Brucella anthropi]|uniref:LysR substrate-binding domain-containing protein n=1 Tax=Brucella anthropi TaxID=529 RepID=A0A6I0D5Y3_BRUAN|nr:hypothetical protein F9L04_19320 [Brucella anthropi]KAB2778229.1 hypothetical protein F9K97_22360 [Brucella anthropi]
MAGIGLPARRQYSETLVVSTVPSFAACCLTSRLGRFTIAHPGIEVRIETSIQLADLGGSADVALRHGSGNYPGLDAVRLFSPQLAAVGSPDLLIDGPVSGSSASFWSNWRGKTALRWKHRLGSRPAERCRAVGLSFFSDYDGEGDISPLIGLGEQGDSHDLAHHRQVSA